MNLTAIITACGDNGYVLEKNIKNFMGKSVLCHTIALCHESGLFGEIIVLTDNEKTAVTARQCDVETHFLPAKETAKTYTITDDINSEIIKYCKQGKACDEFCHISSCVPLLNKLILKQAYDQFKKTDADMLIPIVRFSFPIQRALKIKANNQIEYCEPKNASKRSQDLVPIFYDARMFTFQKKAKKSPPKCVPFEIDEKYVQNIDNDIDWKMAELKYKLMRNKS